MFYSKWLQIIVEVKQINFREKHDKANIIINKSQSDMGIFSHLIFRPTFESPKQTLN